jgi:hypothetical protein
VYTTTPLYQDNTIVPSQSYHATTTFSQILANDLQDKVASIFYSYIICNKLYDLVNWLGYSSINRTWEPIDNMYNAQATNLDLYC